jgi:hypothetical protein
MINNNNYNIKNTKVQISCIYDTYDMEGNILPIGNYYFTIDKYKKGIFYGRITKNNIRMIFSSKQIVLMMSYLQSKLCESSICPELEKSKINDTSTSFSIQPSKINLLKKTKQEQQEPICVICLNKLINHYVTDLECGHKFHTSCITRWFNQDNVKKKTCPICRKKQKKYGKIITPHSHPLKNNMLNSYMINPLFKKLNRLDI